MEEPANPETENPKESDAQRVSVTLHHKENDGFVFYYLNIDTDIDTVLYGNGTGILVDGQENHHAPAFHECEPPVKRSIPEAVCGPAPQCEIFVGVETSVAIAAIEKCEAKLQALTCTENTSGSPHFFLESCAIDVAQDPENESDILESEYNEVCV